MSREGPNSCVKAGAECLCKGKGVMPGWLCLLLGLWKKRCHFMVVEYLCVNRFQRTAMVRLWVLSGTGVRTGWRLWIIHPPSRSPQALRSRSWVAQISATHGRSGHSKASLCSALCADHGRGVSNEPYLE